MANAQKDTIYVDVDDEITNIIEKVRASKKQIVALVLPKRATVLQSTVNMKLLKKNADAAKKSVVLITSESALMPLAGVAGFHVAKTLQSKPVLPPTPGDAPLAVSNYTEDTEVDASKSVGELSGDTAPSANDDVIELDNDAPKSETPKDKKASKTSKDKKLKVPNFERFRLWMFLGIVGVILLIFGWYWAFFVAPKAHVTVKTDTTTVTTDASMTVDPNATEVNVEKNIIPAQKKEYKKTDSEKAPATGSKNVGAKATGTVTLQNCTASDEQVTVPAGTTVTSNGFVFVIDQAAILPVRTVVGTQCKTETKTVSVTAQNPGDSYNLSGGRKWVVTGYSSVLGTDSSNMSGGTTNTVKAVTQSDVDGAKQKLIDRGIQAATDELKKQFRQANLVALPDTLVTVSANYTNTPAVGAEGNDVTVNSTATYSMLGVKQDDLKKLLENSAKGQIDTKKQGISDYGIEKAVFRVEDSKLPNGAFKISIQSQITVGPKLEHETIKSSIKGMKKGDAISAIQSNPGVKEVQVSFSPFWVYKLPKNTNKITVEIVQANGTSTTK